MRLKSFLILLLFSLTVSCKVDVNVQETSYSAPSLQVTAVNEGVVSKSFSLNATYLQEFPFATFEVLSTPSHSSIQCDGLGNCTYTSDGFYAGQINIEYQAVHHDKSGDPTLDIATATAVHVVHVKRTNTVFKPSSFLSLSTAAAVDDRFGTTVAAPGNLMTWYNQSEELGQIPKYDYYAVAAPFEDAEGVTNSGAVYVYQYEPTDGTSSLMQTIYSPASATNGYFGLSMSMQGELLVIGEGIDDQSTTDVGQVHVYRYSTLTAQYEFETTLTGSATAANDDFGRCLHVDLTHLFVCAPLDDGSDDSLADSGAVYVYQYASGAWNEVAILRDSNAAAGDRFGFSLDSTHDGQKVLVGAPLVDGVGSVDAGAFLYFYRNDAGTWVEVFKETNDTATSAGQMGYSVKLSPKHYIAGAPVTAVGAVAGVGAVHLYQRSDRTQVSTISSPANQAKMNFGLTLLVGRKGKLFIGAPKYDVGVKTNEGAVFYYASADYTIANPAYVFTETIVGLDSTAGNLFGSSMGLRDELLIVGAPQKNAGAGVTNAGQFYTF